MSESLLSVCLITYNHVNYIREAIDGVLMQKVNFTWELLIADDFSTDGTRDVILEYKQKHPDFIKLILQEKNVGAALNWIDLISKPTSKYIAYFEGDDYWTDPLKLQKQVNFLEMHPGFSICFHNSKYLWKGNAMNNLHLCSPFQKKVSSIEDLIYENFLPSNTVVYINQLNKKYPSWLKNIKFGDWMLWIFLAQIGKIGYINETMSVYRVHSTGAASSALTNSQTMKDNYEGIIQIYNQIDKYLEYRYHKLIENRISYYQFRKQLQGNKSISNNTTYKLRDFLQRIRWMNTLLNFISHLKRLVVKKYTKLRNSPSV